MDRRRRRRLRWIHVYAGFSFADVITVKHEFSNLEKIIVDYYDFQHRKAAKIWVQPGSKQHFLLNNMAEVGWYEQSVKKRVKGNPMYEDWGEGITVKGIVIAMLDDELEKDHIFIRKNGVPLASFDVSIHEDLVRRYNLIDNHRYGNYYYGEVASLYEGNSPIYSTEVAFDVGIGGIRLLNGDVKDTVGARSPYSNPRNIDIYTGLLGGRIMTGRRGRRS